MNEDQIKLKSLLTSLVDGDDYYAIEPATKEQIDLFTDRAIENGIEPLVIQQLVNLYSVANSFNYEIVLSFHSCDDMIIFEWWDNKELWLGQRDFYSIRYVNGKFCLGDASNVSFSDEDQYDTLIGLIEGCINLINKADYFGKNNTATTN